MTRLERVLLLIGSPRAKGKSNSESLGLYLLEQFQQKGIETDTLRIHKMVRNEKGLADLFNALDEHELVVLSTPLYVDSLPAPVIRAFEEIARHRQTVRARRTQRFAAIVNSGFPEAHQNRTALAICRRFAFEADFQWDGGLAMGGGEAMGGKPVEKLGGMVRNQKKALETAADSLAEGRVIRQEAVDLMGRKLIPYWLYRWLGDRGWKKKARKQGVFDKLWDRPFV
jgi:multimeric flavodoxin WrbA